MKFKLLIFLILITSPLFGEEHCFLCFSESSNESGGLNIVESQRLTKLLFPPKTKTGWTMNVGVMREGLFEVFSAPKSLLNLNSYTYGIKLTGTN